MKKVRGKCGNEISSPVGALTSSLHHSDSKIPTNSITSQASCLNMFAKQERNDTHRGKQFHYIQLKKGHLRLFFQLRGVRSSVLARIERESLGQHR